MQTGEVPDSGEDPVPEPAVTTQPGVPPKSLLGDTTPWNTDHQRPLMPVYTKTQWVKLQDEDVVLHRIMVLMKTHQLD